MRIVIDLLADLKQGDKVDLTTVDGKDWEGTVRYANASIVMLNDGRFVVCQHVSGGKVTKKGSA